MEDLVEKLQLQLGEILRQFKPIGLKELSGFTGVQEPEYERKVKPQLIKFFNEKVGTLIEDEDKIEIQLSTSTTTEIRAHLAHKIQTTQPSTILISTQS